MFDLYFPLAGVTVPWPILVLFGLVVGVLQGFFGAGGAALITPALNMLGFPIIYAIGSSLTFSAGSAVIGAIRHYRLGNLDLPAASVLGVSGMVGLEAARRLVLYLDRYGQADDWVRITYVALLVGLGGAVVLQYVRHQPARTSSERGGRLSRRVRALQVPPMVPLQREAAKLSFWILASVGVVVGMVAGFLGAGGGFLLVPVAVSLLGFSARVAVASSLFTLVLSNSYGALSYGLSGKVEIAAAGLLFAGATIGVQVGASATTRVRGRSLQGLFGLTMLLVGVSILLQQIGFDTASIVLLFGTTFTMTLVILTLLIRGLRAERQQAAERRVGRPRGEEHTQSGRA